MTLSQHITRRFEQFLEKVNPKARESRLTHRCLLVLPTRSGWALLFCALLIWLLGTNYSNNLVLLVAYFLVALLVVSIHLSFANLSGLVIRAKTASEGFEGEKLAFAVELESRAKYKAAAVELYFNSGERESRSFIDLQSSQVELVQVYAQAVRRGYFNPGRLCVSSSFPFGLIRVWTWVDLDFCTQVFPKPISCELPSFSGGSDDTGQGEVSLGGEDFYGLNRYQPGDSLSRVAWKQAARGQALATKVFSEPSQRVDILHFDMFANLDVEARLSRLCYLVLKMDKARKPFALSLPGYESGLGVGLEHRQQQLRALAVFGFEPPRSSVGVVG